MNTQHTHKLLLAGIFALMMMFIAPSVLFAQDCPNIKNKKAAKKYDQAMEYLRYRKIQQATILLNEIVEDEPDYIRAWWLLGDLHTKPTNMFGNKKAAMIAYEEVLRICPAYRDYYGYFYLGTLYYSNKQWKKAKSNFDAFIQADSDRIKAEHKAQAEYYSRHSAFFEGIYENKVPFTPSVVKGVSTMSTDEYQALVSPDNEYIYFTRVVSEQGGVSSTGGVRRQNRKVERFCFAQRLNGQFDKGSPLEYPFNQTSNEGSVTLTIDNKEMFFAKCITLPNRYYNCDIYTSVYKNGGWSDMTPLNQNVNSDMSWEGQPSISSDGKTLYFVSNRKHPKAVGGVDIYVSHRDDKGVWSVAEPLPQPINTEGEEKTPFIHTDSQTLYFSSKDREDPETGEVFYGHMGLGGYDIFYARMVDGQWQPPKNLGYPINTSRNEIGFTVSTDGKLGYFASNKYSSDSTYNILSFPLYQDARPQKVLFVKGTLKEEEKNDVPKGAQIEIKNMTTKKITKIDVDDETGDYAAALVFDADFMMTVKKQDYAYTTRYIEKEDEKYEQPTEIDIEMKPLRVGSTYKIEDIYFDTGSDNLRPTSERVIESFYEFLVENPNIKIEIQGHTDNVGSNTDNQDLSDRRAKRVYDTLIKLGIADARMTYKGYGEEVPVASNDTEAGRQQNRRTVFLITKK